MKFTRQFDQMDCGPSCIRMVASAYGKDYPLSYLRTLAHLTREGVSVAGIRDALQEIGMNSATFQMTLEQLEDKCPLPAILHWEQNHFVVIYKITRNRFTGKKTYHIANPAYGKHGHGRETLEKCWLNGDKGVVVAIEPTDDFYQRQPVKEKHSFVHFAKKYVWPFKKQMFVLALSIVFGIVISLVTPFITQHTVDDGIMQKDLGMIVNLMLAQLALFVGSFSMSLMTSWVSLYMSTRININILHDYLSKLLKLPMTFFETKSVGDYNQRIGDHSRLQGFVTNNTLQTVFSFVSSIVLLAIIAWFSLKIFVAYVVLTALSMVWMSYFFHRRKALDYEQFALNASNQNKLFELMSGIVNIKLNSYEDYKVNEWSSLQEKQYKMSKKTLKLGQIQTVGYTAIGQLRNILITFWIASDVVSGLLTLGMMMSISNIIGQANGPLANLISFLQQYQDAKISLERSEEVHLCENEDNCQSLEVPQAEAKDIEINNLSFCYTGSIGHPALEDITLKIPCGKTTAIVGESGSGKTTLMKLLLKFYSPTQGKILLDGKDLNLYSAKSLRMQCGIVMQDNFVFSDTIRQNVILGEPYEEKRFKEAISMACLDDFIEKQPLHEFTKIGRDGMGISGGEKQRIMIARAIYKRPNYLMLDEATSSLDAENEQHITDNIASLFKNHTMVVIAHRLSTVKNADNIIVLRQGRIVEQGDHRSLVSLHGYYYDLVKNQIELADA